MAIVSFWNKRTKFSIVFNLIALSGSLIYEILQMWTLGLSGYLTDLMNYVDFPGYASGILWIYSYLHHFKRAREQNTS